MFRIHTRSRRTIPWQIAFLLLGPPLPSSAAVGGQDVEVAHLLAADGSSSCSSLAIASDGTAFVAMDHYNSALLHGEILVYRSLNGGKTWSAWGAPLAHSTPLGHLDAAIIPGTPDQFVITSEEDGVGVNELWIERADVDDAIPTWQYTLVTTTTLPERCMEPRISCFAGSPAKVALIWHQESYTGSSNTSVGYAHSTDGGATWGTPVTLASAPLGGHYDADVALDAGGVVQAVWTYADSLDVDYYYRRATNGGDSIGNWSSPVLLLSLLGNVSGVSVSSSPVSGGVIASVTANSDTHLYISTDAGLTWPNPEKTFLDRDFGLTAWGDGGPAFSANDYTANAFELIRPLGDLLASWTAETMIMGNDLGVSLGAGLAADPSRGGDFAMAGHLANLSGDGESPWFDAEWRADPGFGVPVFEPGFDIGTGTITSSPCIVDLDNDGDREVVFTASNPARVARFDLDSMTATTLKNTAATSAASAPAAIDVDGDGTNEVFVGVDTGKVVGVHEDGTYVTGYPVDTGSGAPTWVSCSRFTGTVYAEVIAATGNSIFVYGPTGAIPTGFPYVAAAARGNVVGRVAIGDVNSDGQVDLVAAFEHGVVILGRTGLVETSLLLTGPSLSAGVSLADLNGDGDLEIAAPRANGSVALIHHDGTTYGTAWPWNSGTGQPIGSVAIADYFGGSEKDLVFAALTGEVFAVDLTGAQPAGWSFAIGAHVEDEPEPILSGLGTSGKQIALGDLDDTGYVRRPTGPQAGWPRSFYGDIEHAPAAADLDDDGTVELVIPAGDRLWILDMGVSDGPANSNWPMPGARSARTGCRDCEIYWSTGVDDALAAPLTRAALHPGEPNPFAQSTLLRYDVPAAGASMRVDVYNVAGRLVRTLVNAQEVGGAHAVRWDGRDSSGRAVASGVYLVRLSAGAEKQTTRVVRLQ